MLNFLRGEPAPSKKFLAALSKQKTDRSLAARRELLLAFLDSHHYVLQPPHAKPLSGAVKMEAGDELIVELVTNQFNETLFATFSSKAELARFRANAGYYVLDYDIISDYIEATGCPGIVIDAGGDLCNEIRTWELMLLTGDDLLFDELVDAALDYRAHGANRDAADILKIAMQLAIHEGEPEDVAALQYQLGLINTDLGQIKDAEWLLKQSLAWCEKNAVGSEQHAATQLALEQLEQQRQVKGIK